MEQYPTDRNRWEIELRDDESFIIERLGWPVLTEEEQRFFNRLESWHQAFFLSLSRHPRLKLSLTKVLVRDSEADRFYWKYAEIREFLLSPIMKIHQISALVFPLIEYDVERTILENQIIEAIEKWGLKAGGLSWQDMYSNVAASEEEQLQDLIKNYTKEGTEKRRQNFLYAAVNINDLEDLAKTGALHWRTIKYLRVWRYFLQDKNRAAGAPPLSAVIIPNGASLTAIQPTTPDFEALHPGNTKPKRDTRERLKVLYKCHDKNLTIEEILSECKRECPDLFDKYTLDTFSKGTGNLWQLAQGYELIPRRK